MSRKLTIALSLVAVGLLGLLLLAASFSWVGLFYEDGAPLSVVGPGEIPQSVANNADSLATWLYGEQGNNHDVFVNQLLAAYLEAKDHDFLLIFNSGGWGWTLEQSSPTWQSILAGIKSELSRLGYDLASFDYWRTEKSFRGRLNELYEVVSGYSAKGNDLAYRVEFLTSQLWDLKIILLGESNGTIICDKVMDKIKGNPSVYSIQTGPPFWSQDGGLDRALVLTDNGRVPDSFSRGDVLTMLWANIKAFLHIAGDEDPGMILGSVRAPGHDYQWQYPAVSGRITSFLERNFGKTG